MDIARNLKVPTGNIIVVDGDHGKLEALTLGDYGKTQNVKADFLGLSEEIEGVPNGSIMPLEEKWVVTISTQYGCSMGCIFCDVPKVGNGRNATLDDLTGQVLAAIDLHPEINHTKRLNIHYARMGEPTFNPDVLRHTLRVRQDIFPRLGESLVHPVVSTMMPKNNRFLLRFLKEWCRIKNENFDGDAGLQISINSTSDGERDQMFGGSSLSLREISQIGQALPFPNGRKYALNFALADGVEVSGVKLWQLFNPRKFMVKITPLHDTHAVRESHMSTAGGYESFAPYQEAEADLKRAGFDVLVFVPSLDEDQGRITCGNAILSGTLPECEYTEVVFQ